MRKDEAKNHMRSIFITGFELEIILLSKIPSVKLTPRMSKELFPSLRPSAWTLIITGRARINSMRILMCGLIINYIYIKKSGTRFTRVKRDSEAHF